MKRILFFPIICLLIASCSSVPEKKTTDNASLESGSEAPKTENEEVNCSKLNSFVPKGWKIIENEKGDLNKDGISDVALVLQKTDPSLIEKMEYGTIDRNPRSLIILFGTSKNDCFELILRNNTFILANDNEGMEDPFENADIGKNIYIKNGTLTLNFKEFHTAGSWMTGQYTYIWRFQDGSFKLIGAESNSFHRANGEATDLSVNFSTRKYSVTTYNMFDESVEEVETWKKLELKELVTFETFEAPWTLTINSDIYL